MGIPQKYKPKPVTHITDTIFLAISDLSNWNKYVSKQIATVMISGENSIGNLDFEDPFIFSLKLSSINKNMIGPANSPQMMIFSIASFINFLSQFNLLPKYRQSF